MPPFGSRSSNNIHGLFEWCLFAHLRRAARRAWQQPQPGPLRAWLSVTVSRAYRITFTWQKVASRIFLQVGSPIVPVRVNRRMNLQGVSVRPVTHPMVPVAAAALEANLTK